MSASTFTEHYELGVYQGHDYVSFLGTYNDAMRKIDNGMFQNQQNGNATASDLDTVKGQVQTVQTNITAINQQLEGYNIPGMKTDIAGNETEIDSVGTRVQSIEDELQSADLSTIGTTLGGITSWIGSIQDMSKKQEEATLITLTTTDANPTTNIQLLQLKNDRITGFACFYWSNSYPSRTNTNITINNINFPNCRSIGTLNTNITDRICGLVLYAKSIPSQSPVQIPGLALIYNNTLYAFAFEDTSIAINRICVYLL